MTRSKRHDYILVNIDNETPNLWRIYWNEGIVKQSDDDQIPESQLFRSRDSVWDYLDEHGMGYEVNSEDDVIKFWRKKNE